MIDTQVRVHNQKQVFKDEIDVGGKATFGGDVEVDGKLIEQYQLGETITLYADSPYWVQEEQSFRIDDLEGNHLIEVSLTGAAQTLNFYWNDYKIIIFGQTVPQDQINAMEAGFGYAEAHLELTINDGDSFSYCERGPIVFISCGYDEV